MTLLNRKKERIDRIASAGTAVPAAGQADTGSVAVLDQVSEAGAVRESEGVSLLASAWRRLRRNPLFIIGVTVLFLFLLVAILAPLLAPHDPDAQPLIGQVTGSNQIPDAQAGYPLGGDDKGRDLLSRLIYGSQQTLIVGVLATLGGLIGGLALGTLAGAFGGWVDSLVMRIVDVLLSLPSLLLAVSIASLREPSQSNLIIAIAIVQIPIFARLLRGSMLAQRHSDHVLAARSLGVKRSAIVFRHMLPNSLGPVLVQSTLALSVSIIEAAALSFLGLGNPDDSKAEWGQMLGNAQNFFDTNPGIAFWPAACIVVVSLGFTLMGESMREALDPKSRR
ncbi:ABC transporter permease [Luteipulveratus sp. YIM 133132]|uniref:ABC transporter permease n=1 Tax=Luteipulveratus flavus TaxID=3031728 RepID=UPI0023AF3B7F|nr:ABC transporter permease [Luteipulveratus sp. YIM 133132]MDE9365780.1 ABC transporter permease [Luteipulveratus sp. YIM 133132]